MQELNQLWMQSAVQYTSQGTVPAADSSSSGDRFDTLLQNKYDSAQSKPDSSTKTDSAAQSKPETDTVEGKDSAAEQPDAKVETPSEGTQPEEEVVPMEQYAAAAGLMGLVQVNIQYEDAAAAVVPVEEQPMEVIPEVTMSAEEVPAVSTVPTEVLEVPTEVSDGEVVQTQIQTTPAAVVPEETVEAKPTVVQQQSTEAEPQETVAEPMAIGEAPENAEQQPMEADVKKQTLPEEVQTVVKEEQPEDVPGTETPLFQTEDSIPVKVAEPKEVQEAPIPLETGEGVKELSAALIDVVQGGAEKVVLTLTPASLGTISVELTRGSDGTLSVLLTATTTKATALLDQHAMNLQQALAASEQRDVRVEVQRNDESHEQYLNPDDQQRQQQQQQQQSRREQEHQQPQDFFQRLRLGLVDLE